MALRRPTPAPTGYDAKTADGQTVQVKTNHAASQIGFRGQDDLLLVLHVRTVGEYDEVYYGPFAPVKAASRYSARDNKDMLAISKLKTLKNVVAASGEAAAERVAKALPTDQSVDDTTDE